MVRVHHRGGNQVIALEGLGGLAHFVVGIEREHVTVHDGRHFGVGLVDQHLFDGQAAHQDAVAVHHEHLIGVLRQFVEAAQIAQHHFQRHVLAHTHEFEVHARAHRIVGVRHGGAKLFALFGRQLVLDLFHHGGRQVLSQIGHVVGVEVLDGGHQLGLGHRVDQGLAHRLGHFQQHGAIDFTLDRIPDQTAFVRRQGLQHIGDVGRVQAGQALAQLGQVDVALGFADGLVSIRGVVRAGFCAGTGTCTAACAGIGCRAAGHTRAGLFPGALADA